MSGKGSLILVIGFGVILGYISFNMYSLVSRASEGMIGYSQLASAREGANAGIQIGLSMLTDNRDIFENSGQVTLVSSMKPDSGSFKGSEITVTLGPEVATGTTDIYTRELLSVSKSTLNVVDINSNPVNVSDSVKVTLKVKKTDLGTSTSWETYENKFSQLGWMTVTEGTNIWFATGDTLYGKVHSNGDIRVNGKPVFKDRVTTSGNLVFQNYKPGDSNAVFTKGYETHVPKKDFPNDLSRLWTNRTNSDTNSVLYVDLIPGASSNNNGYAIIRTGSFNGAIIDTISLSDTGNSVIYSRNFIHVRGQLDGRLSICSNSSIYIDNDITYENKTNDLLGLIAQNDVIIADNTQNSNNDLYLDACIFTLKGKFTAEHYDTRGVEGRIYFNGSMAQYQRGAVGTSGTDWWGNVVPKSGFLKSYRYDTRLADGKTAPPFFPGYYETHQITTHNYWVDYKIANWWESVGKPVTF
ncbi:MAG TPA: hypothetical protein PK595_03830 [Bacteroidota bacterium]|jgi:hypothetical protein|nr:hypothetical protein [Bacteroidota bacterium]